MRDIVSAFRNVSTQSDQAQALYFSLVAMTTVGYGDCIPVADRARSPVSFQLVAAVLFTLTVIPSVVSALGSPFLELKWWPRLRRPNCRRRTRQGPQDAEPFVGFLQPLERLPGVLDVAHEGARLLDR